MKLSEDTKRLIEKEFDSFKKKMYKNLTPAEIEKYGMVYTPADISIKMIERFNCTVEEFSNKDILDPCCGSGNLLVACLIAGADADRIFGNELNPKMTRLARKRIRDICADTVNYPNIKNRNVWLENELGGELNRVRHHIHVGDATNPYCLTHFSSGYSANMSGAPAAVDEDTSADDAKPSPDEALTSIFNEPVNDWAKFVLTVIAVDSEAPIAAADETMAAADYEEVLALDEVQQSEDQLAAINKYLKETAKAAKAKKAEDTKDKQSTAEPLFDLSSF